MYSHMYLYTHNSCWRRQSKFIRGHRYVYTHNLRWRMATQGQVSPQICVYTQFKLEQICVHTRFTLENGNPRVGMVADMCIYTTYVGEWQPKCIYGHRYAYTHNLRWRLATQVYVQSQICVYTQFICVYTQFTVDKGNPNVWSQIRVYTHFTLENGKPRVDD